MRNEIAYVAAHELSMGAASCSDIRRVVHRDALFVRQLRRDLEERGVGPHDPPVVAHGRQPIGEPLRGFEVAPRTYCDVVHLVEGEVERRQRLDAPEQPSSVPVLLVIHVLARQEHAGIEQPETEGSGRVDLTSSATPPP